MIKKEDNFINPSLKKILENLTNKYDYFQKELIARVIQKKKKH